MNNLINYLYQKDLPILASAIEAKGIKWGVAWIKTKAKVEINENDVVITDEDVQKLKNIEKVDKQELMSIALGLNMSNNTIESRIRRMTRTLLALVSTVIIFYIFFHMINGNYNDAEKGANKEITIYILGVLSALATQVFSFYFGSSEGSTNGKNGNTPS